MSKNFKVKNGLEVTTNITASGDISKSGTVFADSFQSATVVVVELISMIV